MDNRHPFPFLRNKEIYLGALLKEKEGQSLGMIPISSQMERLILVRREGKTEFALTEELVLHYASLISARMPSRKSACSASPATPTLM